MTANSAGYSAHVKMFLTVGGRQLDVAQLGPAHCIVRQPQQVPPGTGEITVFVDDCESHTPVFLPDGISADSRRVRYQSVAPIALPNSPELTTPSPLHTP